MWNDTYNSLLLRPYQPGPAPEQDYETSDSYFPSKGILCDYLLQYDFELECHIYFPVSAPVQTPAPLLSSLKKPLIALSTQYGILCEHFFQYDFRMINDTYNS